MPNNKGGVPMYNEGAQYSATISPQLPQGSPASFGTGVAKEMAGMGDAIGKWGGNLVEYALKQQEKADDNYVMRRENEMRKQLNSLLYDPNGGLMNKKGHDTNGSVMAFDDAVDKITQQFMSDVNNPNMQMKFQERVSQWVSSYRTTVAKHEGDEIFNARNLDNETSIKDKIDFRIRTPNGESAGALANDLQENRDYLINNLGLSPEAADEVIQEKYSNGILLMAQKASANGKTQDMLDIQKASEGKLTADAEAKLAGMTGKTISKMKGVQAAQKYLNDPKYRNPDGTLNELALKDFEKDFGVGSTRTEKVLVGGNREGHANAWVVYDAFKEAGYDDEAIAGILGRLQQEHNFSTEMAREYDAPGIGRVGGYGMFQWQMDPAYGGRGNTFLAWAKEKGLDPQDPKTQALYALKEARDYGLTPDKLNGKSAEEVADIWTRDWEGGKPGDERKYAGEWRQRISSASQTGHYEERTVSNYNEQEYNEGYNYLKSQIEYSKAEHTQRYNNAIEEAKRQWAGAHTPSEIQAISDSVGARYNLSEQDKIRLYNIGMGYRVDEATANYVISKEQQAAQVRNLGYSNAEDKFYTWLNANPNATAKDIRDKSAELGVSPKLQYSFNQKADKAAKGKHTWFDDDQCKAAFNNALAQAGNKGNQKTHAMLRLNQLEDELEAEGKRLTPDRIEEEIANMNTKQTWYKGNAFEADLEAADIDYQPGYSPNETKMNTQKDDKGDYVNIDDDVVEGWAP